MNDQTVHPKASDTAKSWLFLGLAVLSLAIGFVLLFTRDIPHVNYSQPRGLIVAVTLGSAAIFLIMGGSLKVKDLKALIKMLPTPKLEWPDDDKEKDKT